MTREKQKMETAHAFKMTGIRAFGERPPKKRKPTKSRKQALDGIRRMLR